MPNWPIGQGMRDYLMRRVFSLASRPVTLSRLNFPLDVDQIQHGGLNLSNEQLATLKRLFHEGITTIDRTSEVRLAFLRDYFPELRRGVVLKLTLPKSVFTGKGNAYGMPAPKFTPHDEAHYLVPRFDNLDPEQRAGLITWLDRVIRQERMNEVVEQCVQHIIHNDKRTPTIAHLMSIWPTIGSVIDPDVERHQHARKQLEEWRERFRNPPLRNKQLYVPDVSFITKWGKFIKIADVQIAQGLLLSEPDESGPIKVRVEHWQRAEGDATF